MTEENETEKDDNQHDEAERDAALEEALSGSAADGERDFQAETIAALTAERDQYLDMAKRARAEFDNYQRRVTRDMQEERKYSVLPLVSELLPVIDNLERALESAREQGQEGGIVDGVEMVLKQLVDAFGKHGVAKLDPVDQMFDPNQHEAVTQHPTDDVPPMTVIMTLQKGYSLNDRIIRPAQVMVACPPAE